ncbi:hypothetical protein SBOR_9385 [Sclerotinia borealis F-4128]|uniref:DNA polymerase delta subunit 4 n=1 Tax=Sclerotinia borealis (strain F-4128) TaxID=1432307 RepID=W9C2W6_SCLBF|nr:hypothetical protein SBOR_9385 [Sclerotinia borealis F-4128]
MPTTRRSSGFGPAQKGTQKTLSFSNSSKITKASTPSSTLKPKSSLTNLTDLSSLPSKPSPPSSTETASPIASPTTTPKPTIAQQPRPKTAEQEQQIQLALKITDAKIRKYWKGREELRLSPRVHQRHLEISEKVLREWDCMSQFGPAIGIPRTQRWHRASKLGLNPPIEILAVLLKEEAKKNKAVERAYVDELMGAKGIIGGDVV